MSKNVVVLWIRWRCLGLVLGFEFWFFFVWIRMFGEVFLLGYG